MPVGPGDLGAPVHGAPQRPMPASAQASSEECAMLLAESPRKVRVMCHCCGRVQRRAVSERQGRPFEQAGMLEDLEALR